MEIETVQNTDHEVRKSTDPAKASVFSIPAGCNFLDQLANGILDGEIVPGFAPRGDPLSLAKATIFVPNRRTARALALAFLETSGSQAQLLPKIRTLGDTDDQDFGLSADVDELSLSTRTVNGLERKLELAKLIRHWVDALSNETRRLYGDEDIFIPSSLADAVRLSDDLGRLLDQITQEETEWGAIQKIVPQEHSQWWSITATFLQIIMESWPEMLSAQNLIDSSQKAQNLINARIEHYRRYGSAGPVIVAGSTGSVPSTQRFLEVISQLPNGAIVLPGLDKGISETQWKMLQSGDAQADAVLESHPQFGLAKLLENIRVERSTVAHLGCQSADMKLRSDAVATAMSLPQFTSGWEKAFSAKNENELAGAFKNVAFIEAANERQEATAIAIALRETLEVPGKTAALVTPDRNLARRVTVELKRFNIDVDDTAGTPLSNSPAGSFTRQLIRFCFGVNSKAELASLLKSRYLTAGRDAIVSRSFGETIERFALRGSLDAPACGQLEAFLARFRDKKATAEDISDWETILDDARSLDHIFQPIVELSLQNNPANLKDYVLRLADLLKQVSASENGDPEILNAEGGSELCQFLEEIISSSEIDFEIHPQDFPSVFDALIAPLVTRPKHAKHPRLHIYGPLEIRLLTHDRVIAAGLNEGTWPRNTRNDAFLNRTMRQQLGMASPERRTGLAAHDFQQIMGTHEVILSRSTRVDKAPAIASRWLQRLFALLGENNTGSISQRGKHYIELANGLDEAPRVGRKSRPEPKPPVAVRPKSLPVTDIETWIRDPYALYAKRILKLRQLEPLERDPDPLLMGTLYHAILEEYVSVENLKRPTDERLTELTQIAHRHILDEQLAPDVEFIWRARFDDLARQFVDWEDEYKNQFTIQRIEKEIPGGLGFDGGDFWLHARADRIDVLSDNDVVVLDYKTGLSPSPKQARTLSPQLALEGAIALAGGFENVAATNLAELGFVRLRSGKGFGLQKISDKHSSNEEIIERAKVNLGALILKFKNPDTGYVSRRAPFREGDISGNYDHLARTREWSFGEDGDE